MPDSLLTDEARAWIGREFPPEVVVVSEREIARYCVGAGDLNPLYRDPAAAAAGPYGGLIAPPLFAPMAIRRIVPESELQADGQYAEEFAAPRRAHWRTLRAWGRAIRGPLPRGGRSRSTCLAAPSTPLRLWSPKHETFRSLRSGIDHDHRS